MDVSGVIMAVLAVAVGCGEAASRLTAHVPLTPLEVFRASG
jgi:hypothetical protein